uniref:Squalene synthase n=1 Tax=Rhizophora mucronata TaxID=61149 RepID=A0A2P2LV70_RHIMU
MTMMNIATTSQGSLDLAYPNFSMHPSWKIWHQMTSPIPWVCFFRKQILFEIIWKILMRYPSVACFGLAKSGVNMLTNLRT